MVTQNKYSLGPFAVITFIYFIVGFLTTVNGQFQGPMKVAFLSQTEELRNTLTTMISFFFFLGYLLNSSLGGKWVNARGYKTTMLRALVIMVAGLVMYSLSSWLAVHCGDASIRIADDVIPCGYFVFLLGSLLMGTSAAILQVVINPYVSAYERPGTRPVQRMNIVCGINSFGTTIAPFFVTGIFFSGVALESVTADQLMVPFLLVALCVLVTTAVTSRLNLPDIEGTRAEKGQGLTRSIWSFRHLTLGVIAIFFYVGTEVSIGSNVNLHAMELIDSGEGLTFFGKDRLILWGMDLGIPALLATLYWGGMMVGRFVGAAVLSKFQPRAILTVCLICGAACVGISFFLSGMAAVYSMLAAGLFHSVMWPLIFNLGLQELGPHTKAASGIINLGVIGAATLTPIMGVVVDTPALGVGVAICMMFIYYAYVLWFCNWGSKVGLSKN